MRFQNLLAMMLILITAATLLAEQPVEQPPGQQAEQNKGAEQITLNETGQKGPVVFSHHRHQEAVGECATCHDLFPQEKNAIQNLIAKKVLQKKQVMMNCKSCHERMAEIETKTGPTECGKCHVKKNDE